MKWMCLPTILICLNACQNTGESKITEAQLSVFAKLMNRNFQTPADQSDTIILDRRSRANGEGLSGHWIYTQLNTGKDNKLYRQRLVNIVVSEDGQSIIQNTYSLSSPEKFENAWDRPDILSQITRADYKSLIQHGCNMVWTSKKEGEWDGKVNRQTCLIHSQRRDRKIRIGSTAYISQDVYKTSESGFEMDMTFLWGSKEGELITLYPVK